MNNRPFLQPKMTEAVLNLGKNLIAAEPYVRYQKAEKVLNADDTARGLLNNLVQTQAWVRKAQTNGTITAEDLQTLSDLQRQVQENPIITDYTTCQQEMIKFLQQINGEISQLLGINFALIARRSSCC